MSFLRTYVDPAYYKEGGKAGLTAVRKAQAAGMSLNDILSASRNQGFSLARGAQNLINSSPEFFRNYVDSGSTTHAGISAVKRAESAGMSLDQIESASRNQGFSFASGAQQYMVTRAQDQQRELQARQEQLQRDADARQAETLRQMEIGQRTQAANTARAGLESKFQIGSSSKEPQTAGTQGFKRRKLQVNPSAYNALAAGAPKQTTLPGVLNI